MEPVKVRSKKRRLRSFASLLLNPKEQARGGVGMDKVERVVQSIEQEGVRIIKHAFLFIISSGSELKFSIFKMNFNGFSVTWSILKD